MTIQFAGNNTGMSLPCVVFLHLANQNHAPAGFDAAVTCDRGLALLGRIVGR